MEHALFRRVLFTDDLTAAEYPLAALWGIAIVVGWLRKLDVAKIAVRLGVGEEVQ